MVWLIQMPVQVKGGMRFLALHLFIMMVISAFDLLISEHTNYIRMITHAFGFIPDRIAVKVTGKDGLFALDEFIIPVDRLPYLAHVLVFLVRRVIGPNGKQVETFAFARYPYRQDGLKRRFMDR